MAKSPNPEGHDNAKISCGVDHLGEAGGKSAQEEISVSDQRGEEHYRAGSSNSGNNEDRDPVSNHEESDYEDNIVVKVPSASDTCTDKILSRRHAVAGGGGGHPRPPGLDNSPKHRRQVSIKGGE